jgi:molybdenum cofactor cytidylyltransferase
MGEKNKLLLPWGNKTVIQHILQVVAGVENLEALVVTCSEEVAEIAAQLGVASLIPQGEFSQSNSLKTGLTSLPRETKGIFFILGDQPFIDVELLVNMQRSFCYLQKVGSTRDIVVPFYRQQRGNPVLFSTGYLESFHTIAGDQGARDILQAQGRHIFRLKVENQHMLIDIDTPEDYQQALKLMEGVVG